MCFYTSWRLSMLAFTTILPMMHITGVYAEWSRNINKKIYQYMADAMSRMGEAVSNIRTVRACSSEEIEAKHNEDKLGKALKAGIRDAIAGGVAAALNDYLDMMAGVLILWYGGTIAMKPSGGITVGQLITYQVLGACASPQRVLWCLERVHPRPPSPPTYPSILHSLPRLAHSVVLEHDQHGHSSPQRYGQLIHSRRGRGGARAVAL